MVATLLLFAYALPVGTHAQIIPSVFDGGVVNNGSFAPHPNPLAPGSIAAVFGNNLNDGSTVLFSSFGSDGKLVTVLGGTEVKINGIAAPLFYSTPGQVGVQIPMELAGATSAMIEVTVAGQTSEPRLIFLDSVSPGIFTFSQDGKGAGAILHEDGVTPVTAENPAPPGEVIVIFCTGLGELTPPLATGMPADLHNTVAVPTVTIDEIPADVQFSGAAPGFVGLNQVNVRIPPSARLASDLELVLTIDGKQSNTVTIATDHATFTHGVASGEVTATSAILWTRVDRDAQIMAEVSQDPNFDPDDPAVVRRDVFATSEHDFTVKVAVEGLQPASTYFYRFKFEDNISETGTFKTPPLTSTSSGVRFTWSSDTDGSFVPPLNNFEVLDRARAENADFFVYLGDTAYMDTNPPLAQDLPSMRAKHKQVRKFRALRDLLASTSTYAIWDDHEVVNDFAGQTVDPALFAAGRQAFQEYMPISDWSDSMGFFRTFRWGKDVELFILDERSFRSEGVEAVCEGDLAPTLSPSLRIVVGLPPTPPPGCLDGLSDPTRTLLGPVQKQFFLGALEQSDATWKIVVNEVPISLLFVLPYDRWEGYQVEREEVLSTIRAAGIKNVVFLTGDLHANAILDVRGLFDPTPIAKEYIAGPVAQFTLFQGLTNLLGSEAAATNTLGFVATIAQLECFDANAFGYGVGEIDPDTKNLTVALKDAAGAVLCSSTLTPE